MDKEQLQIVLDKHQKWLRGQEGGEQANLSRANLSGANFSWADLSWADLSWANLSWANLSGADLYRADLYRADLSRGLAWIDAGTRQTDPYRFTAFICVLDLVPRIYAGCRKGLTPEEYRQHVAKNYPNTAKARQTLAIIGHIEAMAQEQLRLWEEGG